MDPRVPFSCRNSCNQGLISQSCLSNKICHRATERLRYACEHVDCDVLLSAFKQTDVVTVATDHLGYALLRHAHLITMAADGKSELLSVL